MFRRAMATVLVGLAVTAQASAQAPRLRWQPGQVLTYKVEQSTVAVESVGDSRVETRTGMRLVKRWQVLGVDAAGVATVQLSLLSLALETASPGGDPLRFDSASPEKSTPALREQLSKFVGPPLAVLRVDALGRVLEVKESKFGPPSRFESEPPFGGVLPEVLPQAGQSWERAYAITVEPPQGAGEKIAAVQHYQCKAVAADALTVAVSTELKTPPAAAADRVPLLQLLPEGEIVYDVAAGRLRSVNLRVEKELTGHQGEGSSYKFQSSYTEVFVGDR
jgi:hypothetical protein